MMDKNTRQVIFDFLGKLLAIITLLVYIVLAIHNNFPFIPETILTILGYVTTYGSITLLGLVGYEAVAKTDIIVRIIFLILFAVVILSMFFPTLFAQLLS